MFTSLLDDGEFLHDLLSGVRSYVARGLSFLKCSFSTMVTPKSPMSVLSLMICPSRLIEASQSDTLSFSCIL